MQYALQPVAEAHTFCGFCCLFLRIGKGCTVCSELNDFRNFVIVRKSTQLAFGKDQLPFVFNFENAAA